MPNIVLYNNNNNNDNITNCDRLTRSNISNSSNVLQTTTQQANYTLSASNNNNNTDNDENITNNNNNSNNAPTSTQHSVTVDRHLLLATHQPASMQQQQQQQPQAPQPPPFYHEIPGIVPAYHGRTSGPPPSYDIIIDPNAPPPTYNSLFGQVREASKGSSALVDLLRQLLLILIGTLGCTVILGFLLIIPVTMMLVGVLYINDCKAENIPSFLLVGGFVWILKNFLNCYNQFKKDSPSHNRPPTRRPPIAPTTRSATVTTTPTSTTSTATETARLSNSQTRTRTSSTSTSSFSSITAISSDTSALANADANSNSTLIAGSIHSNSSIDNNQNINNNSSVDNINDSCVQSTNNCTISNEVTLSVPKTALTENATDVTITYNMNGNSQQTTIATTRSTTANNHRNNNLYRRTRRTNERIQQPTLINVTSFKCESMLNYFLIVWFLAGCIVVYRIYEPDYNDPLSVTYCNRTVYMYAFWLMTSAFIIMAIVLSCLCCVMLSSLLSSSNSSNIP